MKLKNELTQKAVAKECADWIKQKVKFKSNVTGGAITPMLCVNGKEKAVYTPINGFTTSEIGAEPGNNIINIVTRLHSPWADSFLQMFNSVWNNKSLMQDVTDQVIEGIRRIMKIRPNLFIL